MKTIHKLKLRVIFASATYLKHPICWKCFDQVCCVLFLYLIWVPLNFCTIQYKNLRMWTQMYKSDTENKC